MPDLTDALAYATLLALAATTITALLLPGTDADSDVFTGDPDTMPVGPIIENGVLL